MQVVKQSLVTAMESNKYTKINNKSQIAIGKFGF